MTKFRSTEHIHPYGKWKFWKGTMTLTGGVKSGKSRIAMAYAAQAMLAGRVVYLSDVLDQDKVSAAIVSRLIAINGSFSGQLKVSSVDGKNMIDGIAAYATQADLVVIDHVNASLKGGVNALMSFLHNAHEEWGTSFILVRQENRHPSRSTFVERADLSVLVQRSNKFPSLEGKDDKEVTRVMEMSLRGDSCVEVKLLKSRYDDRFEEAALVDIQSLSYLGPS